MKKHKDYFTLSPFGYLLFVVIMFSLYFSAAFGFFCSVWQFVKNNFIEFNSIWFFIIITVLSCCIAIYGTHLSISTYTVTVQEKKTSLMSFIKEKHLGTFFLAFFIVIGCLNSINKNMHWDSENVYRVLSFDWTITGLSIAVFAVWIIHTGTFFKNHQVEITDNDDYFQRYQKMKTKIHYYSLYELSNSALILLFVNFLPLIISSISVYVFQDISAFVQNMICI